MKYILKDLIDLDHFQKLQDSLNEIYSFPSSIIDNDGNILTATAWQDVCTKFHRKNKETEKLCIKSDQYILSHLHEANPAVSYRCPHGLVDNALPIIIDGIHYGNFFTGQFFLKEPDLEFFKEQAGKYGFDEKAYIEAVQKVPIWTREQLDNYLLFIKGLISVISESGLKQLKEIETRKQIQKSEKKYRSILKAALDGYWLTDINGKLLEVNDAYCRMSGYTENELLRMNISDFEAVETPEITAEHIQKVLLKGADRFESKHRRKDGVIFDVEVSVQLHKEDGEQFVCFIRDITDRKEAENELREKEERFKLAMEASKDGLYEWDLETREIYYSPGWKRMLGYEPDELPNDFSVWEKLTKPEDVQRSWQIMNEVVEGKRERFVAEFEMRHKEGHWVNVLSRANLYKNSGGNPVRVIGTHVDITENKRQRDRLRLSESRHRKAQQMGKVGNWEFDMQTSEFWGSDEAKKIYGFDLAKDTFTIEEVESCIPERDRVHHALVDLIGRGTPYDLEFDIITKDTGKTKTVISIAELEKDAAGTPEKISGVIQDITRRKQAENALESERRFLTTVFDNIEEAIVICDENGSLTRFNEAARRLHGLPEKNIMPEHWAGYYSLFRKDGITPMPVEEIPLYRALKGQHVRSAEMVVAARNKSPRFLVCNGQSLTDHTGAIIGAVVVMHDDTERRKAEIEREKLQAQLHVTQKMESIGTLAGGIAHDFNNILFPIMGMAELLKEDFSPGTYEYENLHEIISAGKRGRDLVQHILAIGRQTQHDTIPVRIQMVLKEVLQLSRSTIPANVSIVHDIQKNCSAVKADPTQIHQVAMNLITNAAHSLEDDAGEISVTLKEIELKTEDLTGANQDPGRYALLTVSDTGRGIEPEVMEKIFDPYFTTKEQGKGTGLGLSVVHGIVRGYGGDIQVESKAGEGTTFRVYLPVVKKMQEIEGAKEDRFVPTGNERILVVDDEAAIIKLEETLLKKLGYKVTSRTGSIEALEKFRKDPYAFDLVLTDMAMPNMTGEKLAMEMISIRPDLPVIMCTGFSERIDKQKAEAIGVKGFLMKPVVNRDLARTVRKVLDESRKT